MTKKELVKLIPNHGKFVCDRAESKQIGKAIILLHEVQRDGQQIWVDIEYDDNFFGRWLCPFEDLTRKERQYVYDCVDKTLRFR